MSLSNPQVISLLNRHFVPVYLSNERELVEMMGQPAYEELVEHCEAHIASRSALAIHPADPR